MYTLLTTEEIFQISRIAGYFKKAQMDDQFVIALCYDK